MTPQEFKAWFDGFTEALEGTPSDKQWDRIKARVAEIDNTPVTYHRYVDRYWQPYYRTYWSGSAGGAGIWSGSSGAGVISGSCTGGNDTNFASNMALANQGSESFNGITAMYALGKADSASFTQ